jgi:hypothetical protein
VRGDQDLGKGLGSDNRKRREPDEFNIKVMTEQPVKKKQKN